MRQLMYLAIHPADRTIQQKIGMYHGTAQAVQEAIQEGHHILLVNAETGNQLGLYEPLPPPLDPLHETTSITPRHVLLHIEQLKHTLQSHITNTRQDIRDVARMLDSHHSFSSLAHLETARHPEAHKLNTDLKDNAESAVGLIYQGMVSRISKE